MSCILVLDGPDLFDEDVPLVLVFDVNKVVILEIGDPMNDVSASHWTVASLNPLMTIHFLAWAT